MWYGILQLLILLLTFYLIAFVCDFYFVPSLEKISKKLRLSSEFAGATLMAVGSSAPELFTSLFAVLNPALEPSVGAGTIVGSAIFNILVIIGAAAMVRKATISRQPVVRDLIFYAVSILLLLTVFRDGQVQFFEMLVFLILYIVYVWVAKNRSRWLGYGEPKFAEEDHEEEVTGVSSYVKCVFDRIIPSYDRYYRRTFFVSILLIGLITHFMVEAGVHFAHHIGIPSAIIGLTVLAAGTSVPDLFSSLAVARKGKGDMAITNAVGSNIFDILFGLSFPYMLYFLIHGLNTTIVVDNNNLLASIMLLFATVIAVAFLLVMRKRKLGNKSGLFLIALYVGYLVYTIVQVVS